MSQAEDLAAIDRYIKTTPLRTSGAEKIHDQWVRFYDGLSWFDLNTSGETFDEARNLRNNFNLANAETAADRAAAERQMKTGVTTEEMAGGTSRRLAAGGYDVPLIGQSTKMAVGLALGTVAGLWALKKIYLPYL